MVMTWGTVEDAKAAISAAVKSEGFATKTIAQKSALIWKEAVKLGATGALKSPYVWGFLVVVLGLSGLSYFVGTYLGLDHKGVVDSQTAAVQQILDSNLSASEKAQRIADIYKSVMPTDWNTIAMYALAILIIIMILYYIPRRK